MQESAERRRDTLMVRFVPWPGERIDKEMLRPPAVPQEAVAFGYLGDLQLQLVFDDPGRSLPAAARVDDLARLELTPQKAVAHAAANTKRENGPPQVAPLGGVYSLRGHHLEYNAAVLLDRPFWRGQLEKFPQGLLAALPRKGVVLFAPAGEAEPELARQAASMAAAAGPLRISAWIYRFDAAGWHPHAELPQPKVPAPKTDDDEDEDEDEDAGAADDRELDLADAARGQRMLVFSILGGIAYNAIAQGAQPHLLVLLALDVALSIYSLKGVLLLSSGLRRSTNTKIACMVLTCVPLVSIVTWITLSVQATRALRAAGWKVGLLGAKP